MTDASNIVRRILSLLAFVTVLGYTAPAKAQSCSFSITDVNFGNIDLTANTAFDTTATFSASCTGTANRTVRVCPNIDEGTSGSIGGNPRLLHNGPPDRMNFNLFQDSARTTVWGSYLWPFSATYTPPTIDIVLNNSGAGSTAQTIYARVLAGQQTTHAGTYTSNFTGSSTAIAYAYSTVGNCATIGGTNRTAAAFRVTAINVTACTVSATDVNFGSTGTLAAAINGTGTLSATCTSSAPYTVALNGGNDAATDPTLRKMSLGAAKITYGLYRDAARTQPWGSTSGTNTAAGTGSGLAQSLTVYGRVPVQATPSSGAYADTIVVTLTY